MRMDLKAVVVSDVRGNFERVTANPCILHPTQQLNYMQNNDVTCILNKFHKGTTKQYKTIIRKNQIEEKLAI